MVKNKTINFLIEKAKSNGYKFIFIVDEIDTSLWQSAWLPGGTFYLFQMTQDGKMTERTMYYSIFDAELAKAIFGADYITHLKLIIESQLPIELYLNQLIKGRIKSVL